MNIARARIDDMINDTAGDLLPNDAPYAQTYLSAAWEWYQDQCALLGVETLIRDSVFYGLPAQVTPDPAFQGYITWIGCSDGVNQYEGPALPQDLIQPLSVWRRQSNGSPPNSGGVYNDFCLMTQATDGLPSYWTPNVYDWREDGLYFFPDTSAQDFRIRYSAYRADLDITQPNQQVPMMRCGNALGARVAFEYASARGAEGTAAMQALADKTFREGAGSKTNKRKQRQTIRRIPYSRRGQGLQVPQYRNY